MGYTEAIQGFGKLIFRGVAATHTYHLTSEVYLPKYRCPKTAFANGHMDTSI